MVLSAESVGHAGTLVAYGLGLRAGGVRWPSAYGLQLEAKSL